MYRINQAVGRFALSNGPLIVIAASFLLLGLILGGLIKL
jgi:hypothetical protein